ncbi:MAG: ABC transporter ATP-binding protein [Eubacteriales bacterium]|nr:ABC transporter ATP-binding protein [Eubacteriales bacterium]MDY3332515.1 ABC transporter ATP-binding protein [Gallibacter sp.]
MEIIKTENLTKYYGKSRGIIDVNLSIEKGECFGFIGPNGAGKSTAIRLLLGLLSPTSGSAYIFGKDITKEKENILREIGYLPSEVMFYSGMKVKDIVKLSADLRGNDCGKEAKKICERLDLDTSKKVDELSFGNRKKVAIVCALQSNPSLIILDEPTGGLDPLMQKEFFDIIRERNQQGATIFLSSHILSEVQRNCTKAAIISEGEIIAFDSVEALGKSNTKRISVYGRVDLTNLDGIKDIQEHNNISSFLYNGDMNNLLYRLSNGDVADLTISEPSLEEVFLHYYEKGGDL